MLYVCDGCCVFCLNCEAWSCLNCEAWSCLNCEAWSYMPVYGYCESFVMQMYVCILCVHPVAVLNAEFCMTPSPVPRMIPPVHLAYYFSCRSHQSRNCSVCGLFC